MEKKHTGPKAGAGTPKDTSWNEVAGWYDDLLAQDDTYQTQVVLPNVLRLVAPQGKRVLDVACGQGFFAQAFAAAGADFVFGSDLSPSLIAVAKRNAADAKISPQKLTYEVAPSDKIAGQSDAAQVNSFDAAAIILAIQNIKEMSGTFKEVSSLLKEDGELVIVLNHPAFRIPKASSWGFDEKNEVQYRRIDGYGRPFTMEVDMTPGEKNKAKKTFTVSFHRPLQDFFKALAAAGFVVTGLEEWTSHKKSEPGPRARAEDLARVEFPLFMTIIAKKNA